MHVIGFRFAAAAAFLFVLFVILGGCSRPPERNLWREMIENGEL